MTDEKTLCAEPDAIQALGQPEDADCFGEIFAPGAFAETIKQAGTEGTRRIVVLWVRREATAVTVKGLALPPPDKR